MARDMECEGQRRKKKTEATAKCNGGPTDKGQKKVKRKDAFR